MINLTTKTLIFAVMSEQFLDILNFAIKINYEQKGIKGII